MEHREGTFKGRGNLGLYYQAWSPTGTPKAILLVVHGLCEHSGRYSNLADYFVPKGYAIFGLDHRGHGKSEGQRVYVNRFSDYLDDLKVFWDIVRGEYSNTKIFLVGHSVGGTIATAYAVNHQSELAGLILSAPALKVGSSVSRPSMVMARVLSALLPGIGVAPLEAQAISRDKAVVDAYVNDPLVYCGKISARTGSELVNMIEKRLPPQMAEIDLPILIMYGSADRLSNPEGSTMLYELAHSQDKTLRRYDGLYHEIFNEPERGQVLADMETWLAAHV
ncbi:MAG: lysophospholipase [Chloroflexi bacterium]|nr:lysophospholipase [Chloroflexota bacterium]